ncbi:MAG: FAD-dependent oxidoreductase [Candidatus Acetothermia bacterium]
MTNTDYLIIGGSAAGLAAGITASQYYPDSSITLIRKEENVVIPCGIPYIFGTLDSPDQNLIPDAPLHNNDIDLVIDKVEDIDKEEKCVKTSSGEVFSYSKLIIATGSSPLEIPIPGVDLENVFTVEKDLDHLNKMLDAVEEATDVVVIGGGFMGLEFADECNKQGDTNVTVVERLPNVLQLACDEVISDKVEAKLMEHGVNVLTDTEVKEINGEESVESVSIGSGDVLDADVVIMGIGVKPSVDLARTAGLKTSGKHGIWVDDFMRTTDEHVFAAGDCAGKRGYPSGEARAVRLASVATTEARVAATNLGGIRQRMEYPIGIFSTKFGDLAVGAAGQTEKDARKLGIDILTTEASACDRHPGKLPECTELGVKLIFAKDTGLIIGGQVYGGSSIGEMINFIGALIQHKMRADEIFTFQMGTHPLLTASPVAYQLTSAAQKAAAELSNSRR